MTEHFELSGDNIHVPYTWEYADTTAREAATGFASADIGKLARQLDNNSLWMLTAITPTWVAIGGAGGSAGSMVLLESHDASNSATLDFVLLNDTYNDYVLKISGLIPASNALDVWLRFASANVPTWDTGNNYRWGRSYWNMAAGAGSTGDGGATSKIVIGASVGTTAGYSFEADIRLYGLRTAGIFKQIRSNGQNLIDSDGNLYGLNVVGVWKDNTNKAYGIRLMMSSGNITSGIARLYGIADS